MENPFLSIVTINYNNLEGLKKTVASVEGQSFSNFEYIVIDGASNDGSAAFIQASQAKFSHWVSESDNGIYSALNKGIRAANGAYILFLNSGDTLNGDTALEDFINHPKFQGDIIYGDYIFEKGGKVYPDELTEYYFVKSSLPHQSTLFKKSVFDQMGLYNENYKITSDREFYIKCFVDGRFKFQHIPYALAFFDRTGVSNDAQYKKRKLEENHDVFKKYFGDRYNEYVQRLADEHAQNRKKKQNLKGYWKRFVNKLKSL